jgi:hypothetical protein
MMCTAADRTLSKLRQCVEMMSGSDRLHLCDRREIRYLCCYHHRYRHWVRRQSGGREGHVGAPVLDQNCVEGAAAAAAAAAVEEAVVAAVGSSYSFSI